MGLKWNFLILIILLSITTVSQAGECISYEDHMHVVSLNNTPGHARGITIMGDYAYVADSDSGLQVIDISDPANPVWAGSADTPGSAYGVAIEGDYAYVADYSNGLQVVNISDPANPLLAGSADTPGSARGITIMGDYAYVADYSNGLQVIYTAIPSNPFVIGTVDTPGAAQGVTIDGYYAYVADSDSGLQVIDISDPANPVLAGTVDTPGSARGITIMGDYAYVADYSNGLQVVDISDPANPVLAGSADTPGNAYGVAIEGNYAYVADYYSGLQVIDISDPANPVLADSADTPGIAYGIAIERDYAYVADYYDGLQIIPSHWGTAADFSADPWIGFGLVQFTDLSYYDPSFWLWEFGDGGYSTEQHPSHIYLEPNKYTVSLISMSVNGQNTITKNGCITILPSEVIADFHCSTYFGAAPLSCVFANATTGINIENYLWDFGDDGHSTEQHPSHTFTNPNDYTVTLTAYGPENESTITKLIEVRTEAPIIASITDIPEDQGGRVYLDVLRTVYDTNTLRSVIYTIQRCDDGQWTTLLSGAGNGQSHYRFEATTLLDSKPAEFRVIAEMDEGNFASEPAWGSSLDNIAPSVPEGLVVYYSANGNVLNWQRSYDDDFQFFRVYRSETEDFEPSTGTLAHQTIETEWTDSGNGFGWFYKISAIDYAGNESEPSSPDELSNATEMEIPNQWALHPCVPNPFNPATMIHYDVPQSGGSVNLVIYNVAGSRVTTLVKSWQEPGQHEILWQGNDDTGRELPSGIYFLRLVTEGVMQTQKLVLVR